VARWHRRRPPRSLVHDEPADIDPDAVRRAKADIAAHMVNLV
jgi:hypothetical protein